MKLLATTVITATILASAFSGAAHAAGSASFSLSPASGSHEKNSNFSVTIRETGSDVNAVTAKLTFDPAKLACVSVSGAASTFANTFDNVCGNGTARITAFTNGGETVSGAQTVGTVTFKALADSGSAAVSFAADSKIASNGTDIWNGNTAGGTYTFTGQNLSTTAPAPTATKPASTKKASNNTPVVANATDSQPVAAETTSAPAETSKPAKTETQPAKKSGNSTTAWIIGGLLAAAALATAGLYYVNKRREAAEAAAAAAAARKANVSKKAPVKKPVAKKRAAKK